VITDYGSVMASPDGGTDNLTNELVGIGYCFGGCTKNADCLTGVCQINEGFCVKTAATPTKAVGAACTSADTATTPSACDCFLNTVTNAGYCSQFCTVGTTGACPTGYICDAREPTELIDETTDAAVPGFAMQNVGLSGSCLIACAAAGDAGACPSGTTCGTGSAAGLDCVP
jgi:hypothetical protein